MGLRRRQIQCQVIYNQFPSIQVSRNVGLIEVVSISVVAWVTLWWYEKESNSSSLSENSSGIGKNIYLGTKHFARHERLLEILKKT